MGYRFNFTPDIVRYLQAIERARAEVKLTVLPPGLAEWVGQGWLEISGASREGRRYKLSAVYRRRRVLKPNRKTVMSFLPGQDVRGMTPDRYILPSSRTGAAPRR